MRTDVTVVDTTGAEHDIAIEAPPETPWQTITAAVARAGIALDPTLFCGPVVLAPDSVVGVGVLRAGAAVRAVPSRPGPPSGPTLDVVGGPNAGRSLRLTSTQIVGRDPSCDLVLDDPDVSRRHLAVTLLPGGAEVRDLSTTHPTLLEGAPVLDGQRLRPGEVIGVGRSFLTVRGVDDPTDPPPLPPPSGPSSRHITMPAPVASPRAQRRLGPALLAAGVPALLGALAAWFFDAPQMLLFALLTPATMAASSWATRLGRRGEVAASEREYQRLRIQAEHDVEEIVSLETRARRHAHPDPAILRRFARGASTMASTAPALTLGYGPAPAAVEVRGGTQPELWTVPTVVDLTMPLAVQGPRELVDGLLRWMLCQLAARCEVDLVLVATERPDDWHWARWLPRLSAVTTATARQELLRSLSVHSPTVLMSVDDDPSADVVAFSKVHQMDLAVISAGRLGGHARVVSLSDGAWLLRPEVPTRFAVTGLDTELAEEIARGLAGRPNTTSVRLPRACRLLDVLGLDPSSLPRSVTSRWAQTDSGTLRAAVGRSDDGVHVVDLDLDGPHTLIAGTTGSGKSELLKALVLSLAASYPPDAVTFILVDYKGGAAFSECAALPHTVGFVTDLDGSTTRRALRSLGAELRRREAAFAEARVTDLAAYRDAGVGPALPRLVLVVDEFAALTTELPEFIPGLIDIAQRGRSLGVHLVLATQRPTGAVSPEIRANTPLRIALRTVSAADSVDVLETPAAAGIRVDTPGRAIQRGSPLRHFQVAQANVSTSAKQNDVVVTRLDRWRRMPASASGDIGLTDAEVLSRSIAKAAEHAGCAVPRPPWLPALPSRLRPDDPRLATDVPELPIGLVDLPDLQRQDPLTIDLVDGGGVLLVGGPRSGRTSGLLTIAAGAALRKSPATLEMYGIDCAGRDLDSLASLPHTGTTIRLDDGFGAIARLIERLTERTTALRASRKSGAKVPLVLVLVDGWAAFVSAAEDFDVGRTSNAVLALIRDAAGTGVTVVIAGDRTALMPRLASAVRMRLVLGFPDAQDYAVAGVDGALLPSPLVPGRGVRAQDGAVFQLLDPTDLPAPTWSGRSPNPAVIHLRPLPTVAEPTSSRPGYLCLGLGGDAAEPVWVTWRSGARMLVAGGPRSGRTSLLCSLLRQAVDANLSVTVATPEPSPLHDEALRQGLQPIGPGSDASNLGADVLLVDDSEAFLDVPAGAALEAQIRETPHMLVAVAARSDDPSINIRGLGHLVRRRRTGVLLKPGPFDGELLGQRLRRDQLGGPAGRAIVIGEPSWGQEFSEPLAVQLLSR